PTRFSLSSMGTIQISQGRVRIFVGNRIRPLFLRTHGHEFPLLRSEVGVIASESSAHIRVWSDSGEPTRSSKFVNQPLLAGRTFRVSSQAIESTSQEDDFLLPDELSIRKSRWLHALPPEGASLIDEITEDDSSPSSVLVPGRWPDTRAVSFESESSLLFTPRLDPREWTISLWFRLEAPRRPRSDLLQVKGTPEIRVALDRRRNLIAFLGEEPLQAAPRPANAERRVLSGQRWVPLHLVLHRSPDRLSLYWDGKLLFNDLIELPEEPSFQSMTLGKGSPESDSFRG
ncbi:MAG: hypothetical protein AAGJ31_03355, partial [Verrucomicrobiota bacterium]